MDQHNGIHTIRDLIRRMPQNDFFVMGITGPAGAGKTNMITPIVRNIVESTGEWCTVLGLDSFFKLSSEDRAQWLKEGKELGAREHAFRRDQMSWWDFPRVEESLRSLKCGEPLNLLHVYNRADKGRLTGEIHIEPPPQKGILLIDGVAIAHLREIDVLLYVHADDSVRFERLMVRDIHRGYEAAKERFDLTQEFERPYFRHYWRLIDYYVDNSGVRTQADEDFPITPRPDTSFF